MFRSVLLTLGLTICLGGVAESMLFYAGVCDMTNLTMRYNTCPPGSCCVKDSFEPDKVFCKPISTEGGPCYAAQRVWDASCPCAGNLTCVPHLQVPTWTSLYGTCH